jgi:hypothetical protein
MFYDMLNVENRRIKLQKVPVNIPRIIEGFDVSVIQNRSAQPFFVHRTKSWDTIMTYLDWGCDPLAAECQSCLNALCNSCEGEFRKNPGYGEECSPSRDGQDFDEPDCDRCDIEKKPDCLHCTVVLDICRGCGENTTCEFKICS